MGIILEILKLWHEKDFTRERQSMLFFLKYLSQTQEISIERLEKMLKESKINGGELMQTLAEQLRQDGIKIGEEKGIKIGEEKGKVKKAIETAKNLLEMGIDIDIISKATGLSKEEIEKL